MYNKRVWFSHAASHHRPHFPYSSPPSHHSHLTQYDPYLYLYLCTFPTQLNHHTILTWHIRHICIYTYIHICTLSLLNSSITPSLAHSKTSVCICICICTQVPLSNLNLYVYRAPNQPKNQTGWKCGPHFHPIWFLSFHYQRAHFYPDVLLLRYAWMQIRTWDHVFLFALLHTSQQDDRQNAKHLWGFLGPSYLK